MRMSGWIAATALGASLAAAPVPSRSQDLQPPSFDCRAARTFVEKAICADDALADKDARMAAAYRSLIEEAREGGGPGTDLSSFRQDQKRWMARRDRCTTTACLHALYDERIGYLTVER